MNSKGILVKFIGEDCPTLFSFNDVEEIEDIEFDFMDNKTYANRFFGIPTETKNIFINLERVESIRFIYE